MELHIRDSIIFGERNPKRSTPFITWVWDREPTENDIVILTETHLHEALSNPSKRKIALLVEPPAVSGYAYEYIKENYDLFEYIFTFDDSLLPLSKKFISYTWGTPWLGTEIRKIYPKNRMVSLIASNKNFTIGHRLRHEIALRYRDRVDVMGLGYAPIVSKEEGLSRYRYSIAIENSKLNTYFTEKLLDCFLTGVVPIYWGCPKIGDLFDAKGMIYFDTAEDVRSILEKLSEKDYQDRMPYIQHNYEIALEYEYFEKPIYEFLKDKI
jgi:hypothetical protein